MTAYVAPIVLGAMLSLLGILNMTGNIRSVHLNQRINIIPEDIDMFSKLIGIGTLTVGISCILFGILEILHDLFYYKIFIIVGIIIISLGSIIGCGICIYSILKYNFGFFRK